MIEQKKLILLDLTGVAFMDSCGLGEMVASQISLENAGGCIKIFGLSANLRELLNVSRLLTVFDVSDNEAEAMQKFTSGADTADAPQLALV